MLKSLGVMLLVAAFMSGCASGSKKAEEAADQAKQEAEAAKAEAEEKAEEAKAKAEKASAANMLTCEFKEDKRTIEITDGDNGGCEVLYTKNNEQKSIASSAGSKSYCEEVQTRVKNNLESAGFKCM